MPSRYAKTRESAPLLAALGLLVLCALGVDGCGQKKVIAAAPVIAPSSPDVHPMTIAPDTDASPPLDAAATVAPPVAAAVEAPSVGLPPAKEAAPPRRTPSLPAASDASNEADSASHPPAPRIAPQMSPGDQRAYQRRINDDSAAAQKNLQTAGRQLNAAQQDLADKIRGFLDQSRAAGKEGDWARAENLAQKARLLSVELINSL